VTEQSVIVTFYDFAGKFWTEVSRPLDALFELEDQLLAALEGKTLGELDGHEIAMDGSEGFFFLYGADAEALYSAIEPVLRASVVTQGGNATLRFGPPNTPNVRERYIEIKPHTH
jgi:hypothetical protein